jgi:hypothetical protein
VASRVERGRVAEAPANEQPGLAHAAETGTPARVTDHHSTFSGAHLLALPGDQLLSWEVHGRAQLRSTAGVWSDFNLPLTSLMDVMAFEGGMLVAGQNGEGRAVVGSFALTGRERERWVLPKSAEFGVDLDVAPARATIREGVALLRSNGLVELRRHVADVHAAASTRPRTIEDDGQTVACHPADLSMAHRAPGHCWQLGPGGWSLEGSFLQFPLGCGRWLVVRSGAEALGLTVHALASGQVAGAKSYAAAPVLACAGPDELLVGGTDLSLLQLPSLQPVWQRGVGVHPVRELAVLEHHYAYLSNGTSEVILLPRAAGESE